MFRGCHGISRHALFHLAFCYFNTSVSMLHRSCGACCGSRQRQAAGIECSENMGNIASMNMGSGLNTTQEHHSTPDIIFYLLSLLGQSLGGLGLGWGAGSCLGKLAYLKRVMLCRKSDPPIRFEMSGTGTVTQAAMIGTFPTWFTVF